jgi:putative FmdB family regulatory protein
MPIYEFFCHKCNMIFNFFSKSVDTEKRPLCPQCRKIKLQRQVSVFSSPRGRGTEEDDMAMPDLDESKMERAMSLLASEAEHIDENDPRQAANLMRKLTDMTGLNLGAGMEEALNRMEAGEDPEKIEAEMGDILEEEDPFGLSKKSLKGLKSGRPKIDEKLYDL